MDVKDTIAETVAGARERLTELSHRLHAHPEVAWAEERAAAWVAAELADAGFDVHANACGLPTAFIARAGTGPLHVGICAEYDALPALGHACGHNIIAAAAVGAGLALAATADDLGLTVTVFGTPAEEGGGGKVYMLERGAFGGVHAAMMVHPGPVDVAEARPFAVSHLLVRYRGRATHAAAYPERGVNAADAFTIAQVAIGLLRQQLLPSTRVHGIITHGGDAPNAIPDSTEGRWYVRAGTLRELAGLEPRVRRCFEAGALATGCELEIEAEAPPYAEFRNDPDLLPLYRANAERLGRQFTPAEGTAPGGAIAERLGRQFTPAEGTAPGGAIAERLGRQFAPAEGTAPGGADAGPAGDAGDAGAGRMNRASTDMGNVSLVVPSIHPYIGIGSLPAVNHQKEFAAHCVTQAADRALIDGAIGLAWTAADAALDEAVRGRLLAEGH
jgi:amidohydrolase